MEDYDNDLIRVVLAELVEDLGGIVKLDAKKILNKARVNKFKQIRMTVNGDEAIVEIFDDEDEN
jgi:hypothetical protein